MKYPRKRQLGLLWSIVIVAAFVAASLLLSIAPAGAQGGDGDVCWRYDDHGVCTLWRSQVQTQDAPGSIDDLSSDDDSDGD